MHYRFIILATLCLNFWVNPIFAIWPFSSGNPPLPISPAPPPPPPPPAVAETEKKVEEALPVSQPAQEPLPSDVAALSPPPAPPSLNITDPPPANSNRKKDGCEFIGAHAIADWLNSINIGSFFDYTSRHVLRNDECFVILDSRQSLTIWMEPYGFNAHYRSPTKSKNVDLTLSSFGTSLGASYALFDELHLGGGAGYFHSNFDSKGDKGTHINGVYFGPSVEYLFSEGSVGFMIMGIGNFYGGQRKIGTECKTHPYNTQSWDLDMRLEAEYDLHPPTEFFIKDLTLHPFVRIDYLNVFERGSHQKGFDLKAKHSSFFYSKLSMRFEKMVLCNKSGFLTSNVDVGWVNMTPLSSDAFEWRAKEKDKVVHLTTESKNQCVLGLEFVGGYHNGLLAGIGYQATIGASSPMQTGRVRIEWNW